MQNMMTETKKEVKIDRVKSSQLGIFIGLVEKDTPMEDFSNLDELAKHISVEFDVNCMASDLEKYLSLDSEMPIDNFELESKKIEYYGF